MSKDAEIERAFERAEKDGRAHVLEQTENPIVARLYYELSNLQRWDICKYEYMDKLDWGQYLDRDEVIKVVAAYLEELEVKP